MVFAVASVAGVIAVLVLIIDIAGKRAEQRRELEKRLGRYTSEYGSLLEEFEGYEDYEERVSNLTYGLDSFLAEFTAFPNFRLRLRRANLALTIGEYFALRVSCTYLGFFVAYSIAEQLLVAVIAGFVGFLLPDWWLTVYIERRQNQIRQQLPYTLELWSTLSNEFTISQSLSMLAETCTEPIATEFRRASIELQLGVPQEDVYKHLLERVSCPEIKLVLEAVTVQQTAGGTLSEVLRSVQKHLQRAKQIQLRNGFLVYFHDLMFPMVIGIIFFHWVVFKEYFDSMGTRVEDIVFTLSVYAFLSLSVLIVSTAGQRLQRVENRFSLFKTRDATTASFVSAVRITSLLLFLYAHTLDLPLGVMIWGWLMFIGTEWPHISTPIVGLGLTVASVQLIQSNTLQIDLSGVEVLFHPSLTLVMIQLLCLGAVLGGVLLAGRLMASGDDPLVRRLAEYGERDLPPASLEEVELSLSTRERVIMPVFKQLALVLSYLAPSAQVSHLWRKITQTGRRMDDLSTAFHRFLTPCLFGIGTFYVFWTSGSQIMLGIGLALTAILGGYWLGENTLNAMIAERRQRILSQLPETLFILELWLSAGVHIDTAMARIFAQRDNELGGVFGRILSEFFLGKDRDEALHDITQELGLEEFSYLSAAIIHFRQIGPDVPELLAGLREQLYQQQEVTLQQKISLYRFWHDLVWHFLLWIGLLLWLLGPVMMPYWD